MSMCVVLWHNAAPMRRTGGCQLGLLYRVHRLLSRRMARLYPFVISTKYEQKLGLRRIEYLKKSGGQELPAECLTV